MELFVHRLRLIGIGNEFRSDDAVGLTVARTLAKQLPADVQVLEARGEGVELVNLLKDVKAAVVIDAVASGAPPGTLFRFEAHHAPLPAIFPAPSTHAFGLAGAIELARALNQLPSFLIVYGIEGKNFSEGIGLSVEVETATETLVQQIRTEVQTLFNPNGSEDF